MAECIDADRPAGTRKGSRAPAGQQIAIHAEACNQERWQADRDRPACSCERPVSASRVDARDPQPAAHGGDADGAPCRAEARNVVGTASHDLARQAHSPTCSCEGHGSRSKAAGRGRGRDNAVAREAGRDRRVLTSGRHRHRATLGGDHAVERYSVIARQRDRAAVSRDRTPELRDCPGDARDVDATVARFKASGERDVAPDLQVERIEERCAARVYDQRGGRRAECPDPDAVEPVGERCDVAVREIQRRHARVRPAANPNRLRGGRRVQHDAAGPRNRAGAALKIDLAGAQLNQGGTRRQRRVELQRPRGTRRLKRRRWPRRDRAAVDLRAARDDIAPGERRGAVGMERGGDLEQPRQDDERLVRGQAVDLRCARCVPDRGADRHVDDDIIGCRRHHAGAPVRACAPIASARIDPPDDRGGVSRAELCRRGGGRHRYRE